MPTQTANPLQLQRDITSLARLGAAIRVTRKSLGWTQERLSQHSGIGRRRISDIELGKTNVRISTVLNLLRALDATLSVDSVDRSVFQLDTFLDSHRRLVP